MSASVADSILQCVQDQQTYLIDLLKLMVHAESPSSHPESHRQMVTVLHEALASLDFRISTFSGNSPHEHIYARRISRTKGAPVQLLLGHLDTVWPVGTISQRPLTIEGNEIRGPGVFDMKGGLAQIIVALRTIRELRMPMPLEPIVFINSDEEIGSRTSTRYVRSLARCVRRAFVLEPAMGEEGLIKTARKGIGRFTITVHGKAAHAGLDPEAGASAILELSHVIQSLFALNDADKGITVNVGTVDGGAQPNVIAAYSQAVVDVRVPTAADGKRVHEAIYNLKPVTAGIRLTIEGGIGRPSMERTPRNLALWGLARTLGQDLGINLMDGSAGGGSDGNTTSQYTATLDGLGPVGHGAHAEHEFLYIDKTLERTALLAALLLAPPIDGDLS